jgi:hypothetical protein
MAIKVPVRRDTDPSTTTQPAPAIRRVITPVADGSKSAFTRATATQSRRMIMSLSGEEKSGKNHTSLTFPAPIYIHSFDIGLEGVVDKFINGQIASKEIYVADYELEIQPGEASPQEVADSADKVWSRFVTNYKDGLRSCGNGTTVVDTDGEAWQLCRLARFGKIAQILPHHYGPVNAEFRDIIRESYNHSCNVVLLSQRTDVWENYLDSKGQEKGRKTGEKARKGFGELPFLVQINAVCNRLDLAGGGSEFSVTIEDCRFNPDANGVTVPNDYDMIHMTVFGE